MIIRYMTDHIIRIVIDISIINRFNNLKFTNFSRVVSKASTLTYSTLKVKATLIFFELIDLNK